MPTRKTKHQQNFTSVPGPDDQWEIQTMDSPGQRSRNKKLPSPPDTGYYVLQWFTDERDLALAEMRDRLKEQRTAESRAR